ncbi:hypothetical protein GCM10011529_24290 [Polymorphobacter glacialis]|uniref:Uncharacterized protein n=1 Tax=Sandarakinorhabdus glacialis TaxID=1614636 RepID=A0A916ZYG0_9SPHN|nr:hypothetical protein GCM10011529_24290 [Polymorphobacter glacialis]
MPRRLLDQLEQHEPQFGTVENAAAATEAARTTAAWSATPRAAVTEAGADLVTHFSRKSLEAIAETVRATLAGISTAAAVLMFEAMHLDRLWLSS